MIKIEFILFYYNILLFNFNSLLLLKESQIKYKYPEERFNRAYFISIQQY